MHINPMENDVAAKAPQGSILPCVGALDKRAAGSQGEHGGRGASCLLFEFPMQNPRFASGS